MQITRIVAEDWVPTVTNGHNNGVFRDRPDRVHGIIVDRLTTVTTVRSIGEVIGPNKDNWRLTERKGKPAYMLRSDFNPVTPGGNPTVDAKLQNVINRTV